MIQLQDLTVGQVSGMIAAAIFVLQFLIPLSLPLVMLGLLRLRSSKVTATAISWSVIARFLHSSLWPTILQTNSSAAFRTPITVLAVSLLRPLIIALVGVAAIVTPLGLYETIAPVQVPTQQPFHYISDESPIGLGTPPRTNTTWSRLCGSEGYMDCPNSGNNIPKPFSNSTGTYISIANVSSKIPSHVVEGFQSGRSAFNASVSSVFDIQYRSITTRFEEVSERRSVIDNGTAYNVGAYRPLSTLLLSDSVQLYEGLIVDMKQGSLGFRNHTAPPWTRYGSTWTEDILFIEPESVCVDTNLTLDFDISQNGLGYSSDVVNLVLTDRGGFVNINRTYPRWDKNNSQAHPELWLRAYKAAFISNVLTMAFMNVTNMGNETRKAFRYLNSTMGQEFKLHWKDGETAPDLFTPKASSMTVTTSFGQYLDGTDKGRANYTGINSTAGDSPSISEPPLYSNPFNVAVGFSDFGATNNITFSDAGLLCKGAGGRDYANITNMVAECGVLYGAPRRRDGSPSLLFDPGSSWTLPMFSCISVAKATIKTVSFRFNGTDNLDGLSVTNITPKAYPDEASKPLWGVENTEDYLADFSPLWGLVTPEAATRLNLSTIRSESLYIPGYVSGFDSPSSMNLPGVDFPRVAMWKAYEVGSSDIGSIDYSGSSNLAMYRLWQDLSRNAESAGRILNLIWTDVAANLVLGTRSLEAINPALSKRDGDSTAQNGLPFVTTYERRIRYRYVYGIPAFLALALASTILVSSFLLAIFGPASPLFMRVVLEQTSAGRLLTASPLDATGDHHEGDEKQEFTLGHDGWEKDSVLGEVGKAEAEVQYQRINLYEEGAEVKK